MFLSIVVAFATGALHFLATLVVIEAVIDYSTLLSFLLLSCSYCLVIIDDGGAKGLLQLQFKF